MEKDKALDGLFTVKGYLHCSLRRLDDKKDNGMVNAGEYYEARMALDNTLAIVDRVIADYYGY